MIPSWVSRHIDPNERHKSMSHCQRKHSYHIALICKGRKVLATASNRVSQHGSVHAEINAIKSVGLQDLRGAILVVVRLTSSGFMPSKPCHCCNLVIKKCINQYGLRACIHS
jgi:hypothetical protein